MKLFRSESGGAAVEFAFLAPILAILVSGLIEVGNLTQTAMLASNAAREGARYAALGDCTNATDAPATYLTNALAGRGNVSVGSVTMSPTTCPATLGSAVTISVPVTVSFDMPIVQRMVGGSITLNGSATMQRYSIV